MVLLSVLIPTLEERADTFLALELSLLEQIEDSGLVGVVEVIGHCDNREHTTGHKRNCLMQWAKGEYVAFVDDDDEVHQSYCRFIVSALETRPDVVGICGVYNVDGAYNGIFEHSMRHKEWSTVGDNRYLRCPNHLNPVRRDLALMAGFPDVTVGEDHEYSTKLLPLLKTEVMIEKPIYTYMARSH